MHEFWFCDGCKSMNRADATRCYKCRAPKTQSTMTTVRERAPGVVLTPGLDEDHRQVAWTLMQRHGYTSAWQLGYIAAGLMFVTLALFALGITVEIGAILLVAIKSAGSETVELNPWVGAAIAATGLASTVSLIVTIIVHSTFLSLTSMNVPALGAGTPRFGAARAAVWWIESYLWFCWGMLLLNPFFYVFVTVIGVYVVMLPARFGVVANLFIVVLGSVLWGTFLRWTYGELGGPIAAIGKPKRLLQDLMDRLSVPSSSGSRLVSIWAGAWGTLCGIAYTMLLLPYLIVLLAIAIAIATTASGTALTPTPPGQTVVIVTIIVILVVAAILVAEGVALYMLARITLELSRRQRVREKWIVGGFDPRSVVPASAGQSVAGPGGVPAAQAWPEPPRPDVAVASVPPAPPAWTPPAPAVPAALGQPLQPMQPLQPPQPRAVPTYVVPDVSGELPSAPPSWAPVPTAQPSWAAAPPAQPSVQPAPPSVQPGRPVWPPVSEGWPPVPATPAALAPHDEPPAPRTGSVIQPSSKGVLGLGKVSRTQPTEPPADDGWGEGL